MLLDQRRLDFAYEQIVQDAAKARGACTVLVFVAPNCDAMCACRILSYMLRADAVSYKIKPVAGYGDIAAANEELVKVRMGLDKKDVGMYVCRWSSVTNLSDWRCSFLPYRCPRSASLQLLWAKKGYRLAHSRLELPNQSSKL